MSSNGRPSYFVSLVQSLEKQLNGQLNNETHRVIIISDRLLHIDDNQLRVEIESNGDVDIAWTLNVSYQHEPIGYDLLCLTSILCCFIEERNSWSTC